MKNCKFILFTASVLFLLLTLSCESVPPQIGNFNFNPNVPVERTAEVTFSRTIIVHELNGFAVYREWYPGERARINIVVLPAGETTILFDLQFISQHRGIAVRVNVQDVQLSFNFEPGKMYIVDVITEGSVASGDMTYGVAIWDNLEKRGSPLRVWMIGQV